MTYTEDTKKEINMAIIRVAHVLAEQNNRSNNISGSVGWEDYLWHAREVVAAARGDDFSEYSLWGIGTRFIQTLVI